MAASCRATVRGSRRAPRSGRVVERARLAVPFIVTEGLRSLSARPASSAIGASRTMNTGTSPAMPSISPTGWTMATVRSSRARSAGLPLLQIGGVKAAAKQLGVPIVWGGDWASFRDGPHFELDRTAYP